MNLIKKTIIAAVAITAATTLASCASDADVASENLSKAAEQFEVNRRIYAINGITDKYQFEVTGRCSVEFPSDGRIEITCKLKDGSFVKHFIVIPDNSTVIAEQINGTGVDTDQYRVILKPEVLVPNVDRP